MNLVEQLYTGGLYVLRLALPLLTWGEGKLARGVRGRNGSLARLEAWGREYRDPSRPLVWFHAPSVGEGLQARSVMEELRRALPEAQLAYTHFSPSAEGFARSLPADVADYLPLDLPAYVRALFDALSPTLLAFSKTEVWPNVMKEAEKRGVPAVLLSATLPESSSRLGAAARALLEPAHRRLTHVAAISAEDGERFGALGVPSERRSVMGDARFDQVWLRVQKPGPGRQIAESLIDAERLTIVAGSTWPADEDRLLAAYSRLQAALGDRRPRLIVVPHEPTGIHLTRLHGVLSRLSLTSVRLSDWLALPSATGNVRENVKGRGERADREIDQPMKPDVVVVDRVGILGDLYRVADIAYVGGGFGNAGLHSVLEPAAFGVPVLFGPRHDNSREAAELIASGGATAVAGTNELANLLERWSADLEARTSSGARARRFVVEHLGAARTGAHLIIELLRKSRLPTAPSPPDPGRPRPEADPSTPGYSDRPPPGY